MTDQWRTKCSIVTMDADAGLLELKLSKSKQLPDRLSLIPDDYLSAKPIKESLVRFAERWPMADGRWSAVERSPIPP